MNEIAAKNDWKIHTQANLVFSLKQPREQIKNLFAYLKIPVELKNKQFAEYLQSACAVYIAGCDHRFDLLCACTVCGHCYSIGQP